MVSSMLYSPIQTTCLKSAMYLLCFASFHFEGEDIPSCKIFAHVVLECFSEVIDDCGPDPFICKSAPKSQMFSNYLAGVLYPSFYSGSLDVPQK